MDFEGWNEGIEKLNEAAWALHDLLYEGDEPPLKLREDLPVDVTGDLIGLLHDINWAENRLRLFEPKRVLQAQ